jgi:hypothetical protein
MISIAICCNVLVGYGARRTGTGLLVVLPFVLPSLFSDRQYRHPARRGVIRVILQNLLSLSQSFQADK